MPTALLLDELARALCYPKLRRRVPVTPESSLLEILARSGTILQDPLRAPAVRSHDPDDDYLIALAAESRSVLVSGDPDLLDLCSQISVRSPMEFLAMIEPRDPKPTY